MKKNAYHFSEKLIAQLKRHEGFEPLPYRCTAHKLTIGYGRNLDANPLTLEELRLIGASSQAEVMQNGITQEDAEILLIREIQKTDQQLALHLPWYMRLDPVRQAVLIDMAFNMGIAGLLKFKNTLALIKQGLATGDYGPGADAMMRGNLWHLQVGDGPGGRFDRAESLALQMKTGQWQITGNRPKAG